MCDLQSCGSAGSGCHPDKFTGYHDQNPLPATPASARMRTNDPNFTGPHVTALGPGDIIKAGGSNSHRTVGMSSPSPADPFTANTSGHQTTKTRKVAITKLSNGRRIPLSTKNIYSSTATGGRGKAMVGGGGALAGTCVMM